MNKSIVIILSLILFGCGKSKDEPQTSKPVPPPTVKKETAKTEQKPQAKAQKIKPEKVLPLTSNIIAYVNGSPVEVSQFSEVFANRSLEKLPSYLRREYDKNRKNFIKRLIENKIVEEAAQAEEFSDDPEYQKELSDAVKQIKMKYYYDKYVTSKIKISENDLKKYYNNHTDKYSTPERVRARHILVSLKKNALPANITNAYNKIKALRRRVLEGESFSEIAAAESDCPSRAKGGDLGIFERGQMVPKIENAAFDLKKGEISDIIKTEFGYHIIQTTERLPRRKLSFDEVKENIERDLYSQREKAIYQKLLKELTKKFKVIKNEKIINQLSGAY